MYKIFHPQFEWIMFLTCVLPRLLPQVVPLICRFDEKFLYGEDEFSSPSNYQCVFQGAQGAAGIPGKKGEQGPKVIPWKIKIEFLIRICSS